jgi:hypothetical protein
MSRGVIAACVLAAFTLLGCWLPGHPIGEEMRSKTQYHAEWNDYCVLPAPKALAIAGDVKGTYVSGFAAGAATEQQAIDEALRNCEQRRGDRRIAAPCQIYAVGNNAVAQP